MRTIWCVCGIFVLALAVQGQARADAPAARAIVDKAIKNTGGAEKLAKFRAATWNEKGTYYGMGEGLPYTGKYAVQWPHQFRMEIEGVFTIVLNGDKGWTQSQGNTQEMNKDQLAEHKANHYAGWVTTLLPLTDKAFTLALLPESKVDNRPAVGVKVSRAGHADVNLYFDKETGLLIKSEHRSKAHDLDGKEVLYESSYLDYKPVEGVKTPMKMVMKRDGKQFVEAEFMDLKPAGKLDDGTFAKP
jgi:outer membrane lipoprotein-sorting protein